jgi:hypothetical protein
MAAARFGRDFFLDAARRRAYGKKNFLAKGATRMALRMVRGPRREPEKPTAQKSRAEYLVACLREEANDPKFSDWERDFILSLARQVGQGRRLSEKQEEILERLWDK